MQFLKKYLKSNILQSSLVFTASNAINSSIPFLLIPVLTRYLNPEEYGLLSIFQVMTTLMVSFVGLNAHSSTIIQYYKRYTLDFPRYVFNSLLILLSSFVFFTIIFIVFGDYIAALSEFPCNWLPFVVLFATCQFLFQLLLGLLIASQRPYHYGMFQITQTALNLTLSLILVIPFHMGWKGRIIGQIIVFGLYAILSIYLLYRQGLLSVGYNKEYIKKALKFGLPLVPHTLGGAILMFSDRLIISKIENVSEVGVYMVGFQFAQIILLIQDSINSAFAPWLYRNLKKNSHEQNVKLVKTTYLYFIIIFIFSVCYALIIPFFYKIFVGPEFVSGAKYIFWIAVGFAFNGMYKMVVNYIFYTEKTYILALITTFSAMCNVSLTYFFVTKYGTIGAAYSICMSYLISFLLTWFFSNKVYPMPWSLK